MNDNTDAKNKSVTIASSQQIEKSTLTLTRLFVLISIALLTISIALMYRLTEGFFGWSAQHYLLWGITITLFIVLGFSHTKVPKNKRTETN